MKLAKFTLTLLLLFSFLSLRAFTVDGINYSVTNSTTKTVSVAQGNYSGVIVIPEKVTFEDVEYTVTGLATYAFRESGATQITLPQTVKSIGMLCFQTCDRLVSINLSDNITQIQAMAFDGCSSLNHITIPSATTNLGIACFQNCSSLQEVIFPENSSLTTLDMSVFNGCVSLESIVLPNSITSIANYTFTNCTSLKYVTLPNKVKTLPSRMFNNCIALESINIPDNITSIEEEAFSNCVSLTKVVLPANEGLAIAKNVFLGCNNIAEVYYGADMLCLAPSTVFTDAVYENATLYVSEKGKADVELATPWRLFKKVEVYDPASVGSNIIDENLPVEIYNLNGVKVNNSTNHLPAGVYIIRQGNKAQKVIIK